MGCFGNCNGSCNNCAAGAHPSTVLIRAGAVGGGGSNSALAMTRLLTVPDDQLLAFIMSKGSPLARQQLGYAIQRKGQRAVARDLRLGMRARLSSAGGSIAVGEPTGGAADCGFDPAPTGDRAGGCLPFNELRPLDCGDEGKPVPTIIAFSPDGNIKPAGGLLEDHDFVWAENWTKLKTGMETASLMQGVKNLSTSSITGPGVITLPAAPVLPLVLPSYIGVELTMIVANDDGTTPTITITTRDFINFTGDAVDRSFTYTLPAYTSVRLAFLTGTRYSSGRHSAHVHMAQGLATPTITVGGIPATYTVTGKMLSAGSQAWARYAAVISGRYGDVGAYVPEVQGGG